MKTNKETGLHKQRIKLYLPIIITIKIIHLKFKTEGEYSNSYVSELEVIAKIFFCK